MMILDMKYPVSRAKMQMIKVIAELKIRGVVIILISLICRMIKEKAKKVRKAIKTDRVKIM